MGAGGRSLGLAMAMLGLFGAVAAEGMPRGEMQVKQDRKSEADQLRDQCGGKPCEAVLLCLKQALIIYQDIQDYKNEFWILSQLSGYSLSWGNTSEAIKYAQQLQKKAKAFSSYEGEASALEQFFYIYMEQLNYSKAIEVAYQSLDIAKKSHNLSLEESAYFLLSNAYRQIGNHKKADEYSSRFSIKSDEWMKKYRENAKSFDEKENSILSLLADYRSNGQHNKAIIFWESRLADARKNHEISREIQALREIGSIYLNDLLNYPKAINYYQHILRISEISLNKDEALEGLANAYKNQKNYLESIHYLELKLSVEQENSDYFPGNSFKNDTLKELSDVHSLLGNYDKSLEYQQQRLILVRRIYGGFGEQAVINDLAALYQKQGNYTKALEAYQEGLAVAQSQSDRGSQINILNNLGRLSVQHQASELAIVFYKQAVNTVQAVRQDLQALPLEDQKAYTEKVSDTYRTLADLLLQQNRVTEALQVLDLLKVQDLQDFLRDVKGNPLTTTGIKLNPQEETLFQSLRTSPIDLNNLPKLSPQSAPIANPDLNLPAYQDLQTRLHKLGHNGPAIVERLRERRPGALFNDVFAAYLASLP